MINFQPECVRPGVNPDQASMFLDAVREDPLFAFYQTALDPGARPGELFALLWLQKHQQPPAQVLPARPRQVHALTITRAGAAAPPHVTRPE